MSDNPYSVPKSIVDSDSKENRQRFVIRGKEIGVHSPVEFPPVCPVSCRPISVLDAKTRTLGYTPNWTLIFIFAGFFPFVILAAVTTKRLMITYGLSKEVRRQYFNWNLSKFLIFGFFFSLSLAIPFYKFAEFFLLPAILLSVVSFLFLFYKTAPLSVRRYKEGRFWISGFGEEYLLQIQEIDFQKSSDRGSLPLKSEF